MAVDSQQATPDSVLAFERAGPTGRVLCLFNISGAAVTVVVVDGADVELAAWGFLLRG